MNRIEALEVDDLDVEGFRFRLVYQNWNRCRYS